MAVSSCREVEQEEERGGFVRRPLQGSRKRVRSAQLGERRAEVEGVGASQGGGGGSAKTASCISSLAKMRKCGGDAGVESRGLHRWRAKLDML